MKNPDLTASAAGHLMIGGVDTVELAHQFGTPLVVYDVAAIRQQIQAFRDSLVANGLRYQISYASKAFATVAMYQLVNQTGIHTDVVSGGELYTALQAGLPASRISFHGNNKSRAELEMAVDHHIGVIILDNFYEIQLLHEILLEKNTNADVMLRLTPGISAHTHKYIQTGQVDSKFGFDVDSGQADQAVQAVLNIEQMHLIGIHAHIGSQIFGPEGFEMLVNKLVDISADWRAKFHYVPQILNLGGGFGIRYTQDDHPLGPETFIDDIANALKKRVAQRQLDLPEVWIEPGRSIVGPAGYNLYTVGSRKDIPELTPYVAVDGGMGDNIRPALYQAKYEAVCANHLNAPTIEPVHLAGKYCESGDILIDQAKLPAVVPGDLVAVLATGAYGYSMASNYNRNPRPAVVFVENGQAKCVVQRESYADLTRLDQPYL
ncbi:diaminopimelate decarboxylase [Levilactobacillus zymae]|uniref:Diaminopimelate decarboxylase n=1 Tax=Levilactobacillus zymae TaxID=267363 RepID=A0ABQ0WVR3_9LACO|nr:diaminopimelate decarboxylase [Levilactobacillus zymae]KRL15107.1 diaminopimelate decarboxylase [Levilactobacillus zymae DSM 19395]QFR61396.1 diaminopimelate decarboxylase [Levilactobacillus zymae]GEO71726.1 diaminopimelate decarboxylase [Levilactobacillus zymae]